MAFSVHNTLHPSTTVEHSVECHFYDLSESNLVIAGANQLTVYRIVTKLLEHCQTFKFYGNVASLQKIALGNKQARKRDSLVISFYDAKLSIVEYDPETHDLKTLSMHYFEDESLKDGRIMSHLTPPIIRVDPDEKCIAMLVFGRHIVVIELDKDDEDLEHELYETNYSPRSIAGSYKLNISEEIENIVDIQFLYNYYDPTLVILYEPTRTWSGRIAMRQDTFAIVALSLNIHQRLQPTIWTVNRLPFDSLRIMPVPKPIGGLLVVGCNELIYLNQSVPAFGMSFNTFSKECSAFPLNEAKTEAGDKVDYINISLDLSQSVFLTHNKILFILKDGEVFLVTLYNDDMRSIKNFNFERVGSTVQPNCLTLCDNNLLFIGSHVGDSILAEIVGDLTSAENLDAYADDEADSMISNEEREPVTIYEHDQLISTSASGRICYGEATNLSDGLRSDHRDPNVELILSAGQDKNGSVCIMQKTVKPMIEDTYELKVCGDLWGVKPSKWSDQSNFRLLLNRDHETMVFSTIDELKELKREQCAFKTGEPSVFAANIGACNLTIQVMPDCAQLISNDKTIDTVEMGGKVCDVCIADPHLVALAENGTLYHLQLSKASNTAGDEAEHYGLSCQDIGQLTDGRVVSLSLYKDVSNLFTCKTVTSAGTRESISKELTSSANNTHHKDDDDDDNDDGDDDDIDYGDDEEYNDEGEPTFWLFVVDDKGVMRIFSLPNFNLVYLIDNFPSAPAVLVDNVKPFITDLDTTIPKIKELLICALGRDNRRPLLFVRSEIELVIYEVFKFTEVDISNHLKIRFKKISTVLLDTIVPLEYELETNMEPFQIADNGHSSSLTNNHTSQNHKEYSSSSSRHHRNLPNLRERWLQKRHWLREFTNISGYAGVFLAGFRPHWFVMTGRCEFRAHPMNIEGAIYSFSQYDKENFIYFNEYRELRIARLPKEMNLDSYWPTRKLNMKETVHFVNYHVDRKSLLCSD